MIYKDYIGLDWIEFLSKVCYMMFDKCFNYVLGVECVVIELVEWYGYDKEKVGLVVLLYDYVKELFDDEFFRLIDKY